MNRGGEGCVEVGSQWNEARRENGRIVTGSIVNILSNISSRSNFLLCLDAM
jgi:hypothetical protein